MFVRGDTFLAGEEVHGSHHLWIVINDPEEFFGNAVFVNVTTMTAISEKTCLLKAGEHPFITHTSCIRFASARMALVDQLDKLEACSKIFRQAPASAELVEKIRASAKASPLLPKKFAAVIL